MLIYDNYLKHLNIKRFVFLLIIVFITNIFSYNKIVDFIENNPVSERIENMTKEQDSTAAGRGYDRILTYIELITLKDVFKSLLLLPAVIVGIIIGRTDTVKNYVNVKFKKLILLICLICSLLVLSQAFISYQN
jgi:hypothetical protein